MKLLHPFKSYWSETTIKPKNKYKKRHNSVQILRMTAKFEFEVYLMMHYPCVNFQWNWCIPSKVIDWKPKVLQCGWRRRCCRHDPYVSTMLRRGHKKVNFACIYYRICACKCVDVSWYSLYRIECIAVGIWWRPYHPSPTHLRPVKLFFLIRFDALHSSQQFFIHVGTFSGAKPLGTENKVPCLKAGILDPWQGTGETVSGWSLATHRWE